MTTTVTWSELKPGDYFRIIGYDDLFVKVDKTQGRNLGCGLLRHPIRFGEKLEISGFGGTELLERAD